MFMRRLSGILDAWGSCSICFLRAKKDREWGKHAFCEEMLSETGTYSVLASFRVYVGVRAWGRGCRVWGVRFSALGTSG